jgi:putative ATP-grasp target RiPP
MSDTNSQNSNPMPFFARFLEAQFGAELSEAEMASVSGGRKTMDDSEIVTLKYPSDVDGDTGYGSPGSVTIPSMPPMPEFPKFPSISDYYKK